MTEMFKLGVLGCGEQAWESRIPAGLALADEGVKVVAVADTNIKRARWVANDLHVPHAFGSLQEMLDRAELDGLIVALPPAWHAETTIQALQRGVHVLCEKPFGRSVEEARSMISAALHRGLILASGYQYPLQVHSSLRFLGNGGIGDPYLVEASWLRSVSDSDRGIPDRPGFWNVPGGRGVGADLASHLLSVGLPLLDTQPVAVSARTWNHHGRAAHGDDFKVEDTISLIVDCVGNRRGIFTAAWGAYLEKDELHVRCQGTGGSLEVPLMAGELDPMPFRSTIIRPEGEVFRGRPPIPTEKAFVAQQRNWVRACRETEALFSEPEDALWVHAVLAAAYESAALKGERVLIQL